MSLIASSAQSAGTFPDYDTKTNDTSYDFTSQEWPAVSFTMPSSGKAFVTIGADMFTEYADPEAFAEISWKVPAGLTPLTPGRGFAGDGIKVHGSRRVLVSGTPGATYTIVPTYRVQRASNEQTRIRYGQLLVES